MPSKWKGTNWTETAEGSPDIAMVRDGTRLKRTFKVEWDRAATGLAQRDFIGYSKVQLGFGAKWFINRELPFVYPRILNSAGNPFLYCVSCPALRGVGPLGKDADGVQTFQHGLLDLEFRTLPYNVLRNEDILGVGDFIQVPDEGLFGTDPTKRRYVTRLTKPAGKILSLPRGMMRVVNADAAKRTPIPEGIPFRQASATIVYIWHDVPEAGVPNATIQTSLNTINNAAFDVYAAGTLLFETVDIKPTVSPLGDRTADVQYTLKWLPNLSADGTTARGHNWILRKVAGGMDYVQVTSDGTLAGTPPYRSSDLADLFRPPQD